MMKLHDMAISGAAVTKSTDILAHARNPTALAGDVSGLVGIGVAGGVSKTVMQIALGKTRKKRKRR